MRPHFVVKREPVIDHPFRHKAIRHLVQIDRLVFEAPPEPFDEDVVHAATSPVHGDRHAGVFQHVGEGQGGELTSLIGIEDLRFAVSGQGFIQRLKAEACIHGVREPPGKDVPCRSVHDRD